MNRHPVVEATLKSLIRTLSRALMSEQIARRRGLLQALDPRTRLIATLALVVAAAVSRRIVVLAALLLVASFVALTSRVPLKTLVLRVWLLVFAFTGIIILPALFMTPGDVVAQLGRASITEQGWRTAALLLLRVETAVTLTTALVLSTEWAQILKALRSLRVPTIVIAMLAMTHRYIFLFTESAQQMFESRQSRMLGPLPGVEHRRIASRTAGVLMSKSMEMGNEVYLAMQSRGFTGEVYVLHEFRFRARDVAAFAMLSLCVIFALWIGR